MSQNAIVIGITKSWLFAAGTMLMSLKKHNSLANCDLVILGSDLSDNDIKALKKIHEISYIKYNPKKIKNDQKFKKISNMAFSRYECFNLIKDYKTVLWIDADVLIQGSITPLFNLKDKQMYMYRHKNIPASVSFSQAVEGYDLATDCYNSGIMVINDSLNKKKDISKWCFEQTNHHLKAINSDQAVINMMLQKFKINIGELDEKYNCPPHRENQQSIIIHPWGEKKFWNGIYSQNWNRFYLKWQYMIQKISFPEYLISLALNVLAIYRHS